MLELALVHRLASLLWRLQRATAIETGLFASQAEFVLARGQCRSCGHGQPETLHAPAQTSGHERAPGSNGRAGRQPRLTSPCSPLGPKSNAIAIAQCFLRLSKIDPTLIDRVGNYEARLWGQAAQMIWILDAMRRPPPASTRRPFRKPVALSYFAMRSAGKLR
jgi:hypothetical protein